MRQADVSPPRSHASSNGVGGGESKSKDTNDITLNRTVMEVRILYEFVLLTLLLYEYLISSSRIVCCCDFYLSLD